MKTAIVQWLMGQDTGVSSRAIVAWMERDTLKLDVGPFSTHPRDPADLGRCIRLMDIEPSYRTRILEMEKASSYWAVLVPHWAELEALYHAELPTGYAPKCYDRMMELMQPLYDADQQATIQRIRARQTERRDARA